VIFLVTVPPTTLAFLTSCARAGVRPHVPATIATRGAEGALRDRIAQAGPAEAAVVCLAHGADSVFQRPARDVRQAFDEIGAGFLFSAARDPAGQPPPGVAQDVPSPYTVPVAGAWVARYDAALAHLDWLIAHPLPPGVHPGACGPGPCAALLPRARRRWCRRRLALPGLPVAVLRRRRRQGDRRGGPAVALLQHEHAPDPVHPAWGRRLRYAGDRGGTTARLTGDPVAGQDEVLAVAGRRMWPCDARRSSPPRC
jgi:hypothetical protein